jgi:transposase InsO family protein
LSDNFPAQIVVPHKYRTEVMTAFHDDSLGSGHLGYEKTYSKINMRFYWLTMINDIKEWVGTCRVCLAKNNIPRNIKTELNSLEPTQVMYSLVADHLGPLKKTIHKNLYVLAFMCRASKYAFTFPVPDTTAKTTADIFVNEIVCKYGAPIELLTDNAGGFRSDLLFEITKLCHTKKIFSTSYHPETQGQVERFNRTLINMITAYVSNTYNDWDEFLQPVTFAYNISVHDVTNYTPHYLMFGREAITPFDTIYQRYRPTLPALELYEENYPKYRAKQWEMANYIATENIKKRNIQDQNRREKVINVPNYQKGHLVWLRIPKDNKFAPKYKGTYKIIDIRIPNLLLQKDKDDEGLKFWIHVSRVKNLIEPFQKTISWPNSDAPNTSNTAQIPTEKPSSSMIKKPSNAVMPKILRKRHQQKVSIEEPILRRSQRIIEQVKDSEPSLSAGVA